MSTMQVVSVAEVLLDPYYRTIDGFKALIEKEWQAFGHRFTHRSNQTAAHQTSGFAPIFLQFLDIVHQVYADVWVCACASRSACHVPAFRAWISSLTAHICFVSQIHRQFPMSFEFNQYFLKFIAYHHVSNRFRTFMLDSEYQRVEAGWLLDERRSGSVTMEEMADAQGFSPKHGLSGTTAASLWDYMDKQHRKSAIFYNFMYNPVEAEQVITLFPEYVCN